MSDEATWDDEVKSPAIDWRMSAALENVPRGGDDVPEVTNLEKVVRDWLALDPEHRAEAIVTPERPLLIDGVSHASFTGDGVALLADRLEAGPANED